MKKRKYAIHTIFEKINLDENSSSLNFEEFYRMITHIKSSASKTPAKILFEMVDLDNSGLISLKEFK
jgi:Ca2+-binding EF-hand superfamily protein